MLKSFSPWFFTPVIHHIFLYCFSYIAPYNTLDGIGFFVDLIYFANEWMIPRRHLTYFLMISLAGTRVNTWPAQAFALLSWVSPFTWSLFFPPPVTVMLEKKEVRFLWNRKRFITIASETMWAQPDLNTGRNYSVP